MPVLLFLCILGDEMKGKEIRDCKGELDLSKERKEVVLFREVKFSREDK